MTRCAAIVVGVFALAIGLMADVEPDLRQTLTHELRFSPGDLAALDRGAIVKHGLPGMAPGEVAVVGAVLVKATKETLVDRVRDIATFKRGPDVLQIGRFSSPPMLEDLASLTIDKEDLDVRTCRVGDCDVRLSADVIVRFEREIDWRAPDAHARAAALFKQVLLDNVRAYVLGTPGRMTEYNDGKRPIRPVEDFVGLLKHSSYIGELVPGLRAYLQEFPSSPLAGAEDFLYWSKEKFGFTPFITVTHVTIARAPSGAVVITSRDVYSSRYFDASVAATIASDTAGDSHAFYLVYVNRSRVNALKGALSGLRRAIVDRRAKSSLEQNLKATRTRLEKGL